MVWLEKPLVTAIRSGWWVLLDELNAARAEVLMALHSLLDDDRMLVISEGDGSIVRPHANCRFFATMNPTDVAYAGTHTLNAALSDRLICLEVAYPGVEPSNEILKHRVAQLDTEVAKAMCEVAQILRDGRDSGTVSFDFSTRQLIQWAELTSILGVIPAASAAVLGQLGDEDKRVVSQVIEAKFADPNAGRMAQ